jgi:hypothetical protein
LIKYIARSSIDYNSSLFEMFFNTHNNPDMLKTEEFKYHRRKQIESYTKNVRAGKIKVLESDYCWLLSNPMEMLWFSTRQCQDIDKNDIPHPLIDWEVYIIKYDDGAELAGFRNPHISSGNVCYFKNKYVADIDNYFNLRNCSLITWTYQRGKIR